MSKKSPDKALLRHIPIAPNSFEAWGVSLDAYASEPTWRLATPHNIQKNTSQNASCDACHGHEELFLTPAYIDSLIGEGIMVPEEVEANAGVVVSEVPDGE